MNWKDTTNYPRSKADTSEPREWTIQVMAGLIIVIHHHIGCDDWFVTCYGIAVECRKLQSLSAVDAKAEALAVVYAQLSVWREAVNKTWSAQDEQDEGSLFADA